MLLLARPDSARSRVLASDLPPNLWRSEILKYTLPEGGKGSCKRCKRSTQPSLSGRRCDWLRPVGSRLRTEPVNWALTSTSIHHWRKELTEHGPEAFPGSRHQPAQEEDVRRLKRELEIVKQERDILKKAIGIFSPNQP